MLYELRAKDLLHSSYYHTYCQTINNVNVYYLPALSIKISDSVVGYLECEWKFISPTRKITQVGTYLSKSKDKLATFQGLCFPEILNNPLLRRFLVFIQSSQVGTSVPRQYKWYLHNLGSRYLPTIQYIKNAL